MQTTAPAHTTVLLIEAVAALIDTPAPHTPDAVPRSASRVFVDATFGRGGHSALILQRMGPNDRLIGIDRDPAAVAAGQLWADERFTMVHSAFGDLQAVLNRLGLAQVDGVLMDLGVSSPQLDEAARGFSFRFDAPLDMRMDISDASPSPTAADWINSASEAEIRRVIHEYGEERAAARIAANITTQRAIQPIRTTGQLAKLVEGAVKGRQPGHHPATRTFQAIRIHVNQELAQLTAALAQSQAVLKPLGRLCAISFHSLEDRCVKQTLRPAPMTAALRHLPRSEAVHPWKELQRIKPTEAECKANPRARSAVLRVAEKVIDQTVDQAVDKAAKSVRWTA